MVLISVFDLLQFDTNFCTLELAGNLNLFTACNELIMLQFDKIFWHFKICGKFNAFSMKKYLQFDQKMAGISNLMNPSDQSGFNLSIIYEND